MRAPLATSEEEKAPVLTAALVLLLNASSDASVQLPSLVPPQGMSELDGGSPVMPDAGFLRSGGLSALVDGGSDLLSLPGPSSIDGGAPDWADAGWGDGLDAGAQSVAALVGAADAGPVSLLAADGGLPEVKALGQNQKLPKGFTGVVGRVTDSRTGDGLIEATIKVVAGGKKTALTDVDGYYRLKLPAGTYDLRVFYELYEGRRISNVEVKAGEAVTLDVALSADSRAVQEVLVEAKADSRKESALLQERKKAAVVQDSIGAQEIARTPDSSASDAVKRVPAATIVDGKYVFLRGLGGRYALTLLNGSLMPSPEPDEPSVPLDLFPVSLLANLNVLKTYSADMPASFGGGALTIETNTFPTAFELKARLSLSGDTQTTFQSRPSDSASFGENFGFRDASRDLPSVFPRDLPLRVSNDPNERSITGEQQQSAGVALKNAWTPGSTTGMPNGVFGIQAGDTLKLGGDRRLGYLVALQTSRKEVTKRITFQDTTIVDGILGGINQTTTTTGVLLGASSAQLNVGLQLSRDHEINLLSMALVNADTSATTSAGYDTTGTQGFDSNRLQYTQRQLYLNQLKGFHRIGALGDLEVDWLLNYSRVIRTEPDIRDTKYLIDSDGLRQIALQPNSGERFFLDLAEDAGGGTANATLPYRNFRFKVGGLGQHNARQFNGRRFRYTPWLRLNTEQRSAAPEQIFRADDIGPSSQPYHFFLEETTLASDEYRSSLTVWAGYGLIDWKATSWLRAIVGLRYEGSTQALESNSPFARAAVATTPVSRTVHDAVPSANVVLTPSATVNVRLGYAYTLARPTFRELGPFVFYDIVRRRNVSGNPNLIETRIHHGDARVEWFPSENEVFAASVFVKEFEHPIERVVVGSSSQDDFGFRNADGATLIGGELEARTTLGRLAQALKEVRVGANLSLAYSRINLINSTGQLGSADRPLQGQSPYVVNAFVTWSKPEWGTEAGVFYNVNGPRISEVAVSPKPDFYEQPLHRLDVSVTQQLGGGFQLKVAAANILNQAVTFTQGNIEVLRIPPGVQFSAALSWSMNTKEKKP